MAKQKTNIVSDAVGKAMDKEVTRRDFLKGASAFFAVMSFGGGLFNFAKKEEKEVSKEQNQDLPKGGYGVGSAYGV